MPESAQILGVIDLGYIRLTDMPPILGVTKPRCQQLVQRDDFPAPAKIIRTRRLWLRSDVERWRDELWPRPWRSTETRAT